MGSTMTIVCERLEPYSKARSTFPPLSWFGRIAHCIRMKTAYHSYLNCRFLFLMVYSVSPRISLFSLRYPVRRDFGPLAIGRDASSRRGWDNEWRTMCDREQLRNAVSCMACISCCCCFEPTLSAWAWHIHEPSLKYQFFLYMNGVVFNIRVRE